MTDRQVLSEPQWRAQAEAHRRRVEPWIEPRLQRRRDGRRDPVDDFLWEYYRWRPGQLAAWHPGIGITLAGDTPWAGRHPYVRTPHGWTVQFGADDPIRPRLARNLAILRATADRPARTGCFGMHEWAMVHDVDADDIRHPQVPLRLDRDQIAAAVADVGLHCTHFDAYRFFTPSAAVLQRPLTRAGQVDDEQPGCLHAGMDLYRYAYEAAPFVGSDLVADCFAHARRARELDMRASPYDLTDAGLRPIAVETVAGRGEYVRLQRELAAGAAELRGRLIDRLTRTVQSSATWGPEAAQSA